jgi:hypothetical protein
MMDRQPQQTIILLAVPRCRAVDMVMHRQLPGDNERV